jgi:hypothetical protein
MDVRALAAGVELIFQRELHLVLGELAFGLYMVIIVSEASSISRQADVPAIIRNKI